MEKRSKTKYPPAPVPLPQAARWLRVPARWLRDEINAGRLPALVAGASILIDVETVAELLADRARREVVSDAK